MNNTVFRFFTLNNPCIPYWRRFRVYAKCYSVIPNVNMTIGKLEVFNVESDSWSTYVERLEQYFIVNETKEEHKVPTLITVMGNQAYELLVTMCTPDKPASKKFADLVKVMSGHLQPKPSLLAERYRFRNRKQRTGESVADFVAELKKLAKHCVFGNGLTESLRDQLV
ncbi:uncharacterized protein LOC134748884 [Cydia strobilella]|uniref:uncharacterized protein LOC134748884 n=1 Tax=Cydia strobilella TaxID=1100964 RepID=UPI003007E13D